MDDANDCVTCGAELYGTTGGSGFTPLEEHVLDHSDPHRTLDLVPRTWFGSGAPQPASGYRALDWYVDVTDHVSYVCTVSRPGGVETLGWVRATPDVGVDMSTLSSVLAAYPTLTHLASVLSGYVSHDQSSVFATRSDLTQYVTSSYLSSVLSEYATASAVAGLVTVDAMNSAISSSLSGYATSSSVAAALVPYVTLSAADARYVRPSALSSYATSASVTSAVAGKVFRQPTSAGTYPELNLDNVLATALSPYLTSSAAALAYATKQEISGLVDTNDLAAAIAGCATPASVTTALAPYATLAYVAANYLTQTDLAPYQKASDVAAAVAGKVFRAPVSAGTYPELNLDNILSSYLTSAGAAAVYATKTEVQAFIDETELAAAVAPLVRTADMPTHLSGLASTDWVTTQLLGYLSTTSASQLYASKAWVNEQGFATNAVYRTGQGADLNLDNVLNGWTVNSVAAASTHPPTATAVKNANDAMSARITALENAGTVSVHEFYQITGSSYSAGSGLVSVGTTRVSGFPVANRLNQWITPRRFRMNYVTLSGTDALNRVAATMATTAPHAFGTLSTQLQIMLGKSEPEQSAGSAFDAKLCIRFVANSGAGHTGPIPWTTARFVTTAAQTTDATVLGDAGDLAGIVWGDTLVLAFTEVAPGIYASTKKVYHAS